MKYSFFLTIWSLVFWSCMGTGDTSVVDSGLNVSDLPEDFRVFYQRFHRDSLFQVEHIVFPLEGLPDEADATTIAEGKYRWTPAQWRFQRVVDYETSDFTRRFVPVNDRMIAEYIVHKNTGFGMLRRFAKMGGYWHLIYYAGLNRFAK